MRRENDVEEEIIKQMKEQKKEIKELKEKCKLYQKYIKETYQQIEYSIWYEKQQEIWLERCKEPKRSQTPMPPEKYNDI